MATLKQRLELADKIESLEENIENVPYSNLSNQKLAEFTKWMEQGKQLTSNLAVSA